MLSGSWCKSTEEPSYEILLENVEEINLTAPGMGTGDIYI